MADVLPTINLASVERRLDKVADATNRIENQLNNTNARLNQVTGELSTLSSELNELRTLFDKFMNDSKRATTLQKAATELIRVRQELEQSFGGYKIVRETMLGVLQATDLAIVKKTTISQVTEELMLTTPDYWLAPCLIAVAGWIGNDRDLANRAIKEAIKRDEEKTALTMALICRRNNRKDTCFEWLSIYFAKQSAANFTESNFTYLNAYLNGVFGDDTNHMCEDYVSKWLREIQGNGDSFEREQVDLWREYCKNFTVDIESQFPVMKSSVREYADIANYASRIYSVGYISNNFSKIQNFQIDNEKLKRDIDQTLVSLISRCDDREEPLRKEEKYLQAIRYFDGDIEAAKQSVLEADRKRTEETIDLVGRMTNIVMKSPDASPSEKKTSVAFLSSYIRNGFYEYITEKKNAFPKQITLTVDSWVGVTTDCTNADSLHHSYETHMRNECQKAVNDAYAKGPKQTNDLPSWLKILMWIIFPIGICYWLYQKNLDTQRQSIQQMVNGIQNEYNRRIAEGHNRINQILTEWARARSVINNFEANKIPDIVA